MSLGRLVVASIVCAIFLGAVLFVVGMAVIDYLETVARANSNPVEDPLDGPCGCDGDGCIECDPDEHECDHHDFGGPLELCTCPTLLDDPGGEWDRAHDQWIDGRPEVR